MEAAYNEEKFKQHIKTIVQEAEGDSLEERALTLPELKELALSMGMLDDEWDALQAKAVVHLRSAEDHLKARNFDEAIAEAERATSINPYLANSNSVLAKCYQMLWLEDESVKAREKAEYYARKELLTDPKDRDAIQVLSTINKRKKLGGKESKSKKKYFIIGAIIVLAVLLGYAYTSSKSSSSSSSQLENDLIVSQEEVYAKYDLVQTAINQRNNMLPDLFGAVSGSHSDLNSLNKEIDQLKKQIKKLEGDARFKLENKVDQKIADAKKLVRAYGDKDNVDLMMIQVEGAENRVSFEKKSYNDAVKAYNILVKQSKGAFPEYEIQAYYNAN